jgi:hypothetical protein
VGTARRECADLFLIYNRRHLTHVLTGYVRHHNAHRPRRSLGQRPLHDATATPLTGPRVLHRERILGGLVNGYTYEQVASPRSRKARATALTEVFEHHKPGGRRSCRRSPLNGRRALRYRETARPAPRLNRAPPSRRSAAGQPFMKANGADPDAVWVQRAGRPSLKGIGRRA